MSFEHIILVYIIPVLIWVAVISITLRLLVKKQAVCRDIVMADDYLSCATDWRHCLFDFW